MLLTCVIYSIFFFLEKHLVGVYYLIGSLSVGSLNCGYDSSKVIRVESSRCSGVLILYQMVSFTGLSNSANNNSLMLSNGKLHIMSERGDRREACQIEEKK